MRQKQDEDIYNSLAMQAALGIYSRHGAGAEDWDEESDDYPKELFRRRRAEHGKKGDDEK